jgi:hypothetical protein
MKNRQCTYNVTLYTVEKNILCVFVDLVIQYAKRMRRNAPYYIVMYSLSGSAIFFLFILQKARYS